MSLRPRAGRESCRLESILDQRRPVIAIHGRVEQRAGQYLEQLFLGDAALLRQGHRFCQRLDRRKDHEVAAELHQVGGRRRFADVENALADRRRTERSPSRSRRCRRRPRRTAWRPRRHPGGRIPGRSESAVRARRAARPPARLWRPRSCSSRRAERRAASPASSPRAPDEHLLERRIVGEHGDDDVAFDAAALGLAAEHAPASSRPRALCARCDSRPSRSCPARSRLAAIAAPMLSKTDEADFHDSSPRVKSGSSRLKPTASLCGRSNHAHSDGRRTRPRRWCPAPSSRRSRSTETMPAAASASGARLRAHTARSSFGSREVTRHDGTGGHARRGDR